MFKPFLRHSGIVLLATAIFLSGGQSIAAAAPPAQAEAAATSVYVVQRGDTLYGIARRFGTTVQAIMQANNLRSTTIYVGQRLMIPNSQSGRTYIVQRGDTLYGIARRFGTTVQAIMQANNLRSTTIYVGQRLMIPGSSGPILRPAVSISPTSGPSGTLLTVTLTGFAPNSLVTILAGPENSEGIEIGRARTNANGSAVVPLHTPIQGAPGMTVMVGAITDSHGGVWARFVITG